MYCIVGHPSPQGWGVAWGPTKFSEFQSQLCDIASALLDDAQHKGEQEDHTVPLNIVQALVTTSTT